MKIVRRFFQRFGAIRDQVESWGIRVPRASAGGGPQVRVLGPGKGSDLHLIGTLSQADGEFVFKYDPAFVASAKPEPLSAFPDLHEDYRSRDLWPFFAVRIPPADRPDVRDSLARHGLRPDQTLEVLGTIAERTISNPYRLQLARALRA
jgi:HipA-like protein